MLEAQGMKGFLPALICGICISVAIAKDIAADIQPTQANKEKLQLIEHFNSLHSSWRKECDEISFSSRTTDYIKLPSYRKLIALGRPSLPLFYERLKSTNGLDFMLAQGVIEITGWERNEFTGDIGEQSVAANVAKKLKHEFDGTASTNKPNHCFRRNANPKKKPRLPSLDQT